MSAKMRPIDDGRDFRISVRSLLETRGCELLDAGSGHEGPDRYFPNPLGIPRLLGLPGKAVASAGACDE